MLKTLGIVQASFSSPLFRANALRKLGGKSLLEWVIRRATDSMRLDGVIVVACDTLDRATLSRLVPMDVPVFQCRTPDMLTRFARALEQYQAEAVVRIQGDNLFIDPALIDRLVVAAEAIDGCDYAGYGSRDGSPAALSPVSVYGEWFRSKALCRAHRSASDSDTWFCGVRFGSVVKYMLYVLKPSVIPAFSQRSAGLNAIRGGGAP